MTSAIRRQGSEGPIALPLKRDSYWSASLRRFRRNPAAMLGLFGLLFLILVSLLAPLISPYDPLEQNYEALRVGPSAVYPFGTDDLGRDILSRVIWGGRESLRVGVLAVGIGLVGGVLVGLVSGFYGGAIDNTIQRVVDVFLAFPTILLLLSIVAALGPGLGTVMIAIGFSSIPSYSRLVRGSVLATKNLDYILASRALGATDWQLMFRHILPNILAPIIVVSTVGLGSSILLTAGLSYIGLGAQPPSPEWGAMLLYGRSFLRQAWWMSVFPGAAIFIAVLSINLLGDGLRDALDPRMK